MQLAGASERLMVPTISLATPSLTEPVNTDLSRTGKLSVTLDTFPGQVTTFPYNKSVYPSTGNVYKRVSQTKRDVKGLCTLYAETRFLSPAYRRTVPRESSSDDWVPFCVTLLCVDGLPMIFWNLDDFLVTYEILKFVVL